MDATVQFVVLCMCTYTSAQPLTEAMRLRSDYSVYASEYSRDYEPYMFAAIPLHAPVPVVHVLSAAPLARAGPRERRPAPAPSAPRPSYVRPPHDAEYVAAVHGADYDASVEVLQYAAAAPYAKHYQAPPHAPASDEPTILYARPSPHGGYTYHKHPHKVSAKRAPAPLADTPYIIRVHKYRIVKDR